MHTLLPFRFSNNKTDYLLTNDIGEYHYLSVDEFKKFVNLELDSNSELFEDLKSKFFVTNSSIEDATDMLSVRYRTQKAYITEGITLHMIVPTIRCNCKCTYCQVGSKNNIKKSSSTDMDLTTARKTVDLIFQSPAKNIKIEFQGGEPTLNFNVIRYIVRYAKAKALANKKRVDYVICTNMVNINTSMLKFIKKHNIYISTSLDGPEDIHCKNRPAFDNSNSYKQVIENIKSTRELVSNEQVSALLTVTASNLWNLQEVVEEYIQQGFNSIFLRPLNPFGRAVKNNMTDYSPEQFMECYLKCLDYIIELNFNGIHFVEEFARMLLERILTPFNNGFVDLQSPSGAGIMCAVYNHDGNIYASDEGRMLGEMGDFSFKLGDISNTYDEIFKGQLVKNIIKNSFLETFPECASCVYLPYCGCDIVRDYAESGFLFYRSSNSTSCKLIKPIFDYLFEIIKAQDERVDVLYGWLKR